MWARTIVEVGLCLPPCPPPVVRGGPLNRCVLEMRETRRHECPDSFDKEWDAEEHPKKATQYGFLDGGIWSVPLRQPMRGDVVRTKTPRHAIPRNRRKRNEISLDDLGKGQAFAWRPASFHAERSQEWSALFQSAAL